jgi:hypothetical protein
MRGEVPITYLMIQTHMGYRAYAEKELTSIFDTQGNLLDGSFLLDGSVVLGSRSIGVIDKAARVLSFGSFERTIQSQKDDILASYSGKQLQHVSLELDNGDRYFSRLIATEPFLGRPANIYMGFEADPQGDHLSIFRGIISELSVMPKLTIEADER